MQDKRVANNTKVSGLTFEESPIVKRAMKHED